MFRKKWFFPALLAGLFIILVLLTIPRGCVYGSYTDWLSQHVQLAETIRNACIDQKSLTPAFLPLGGGSNGYQFSYYGYLRPDIIIGCLFPSIPMVYFVIGYMLTGYFASVLLCYYWLDLHLQKSESASMPSGKFCLPGSPCTGQLAARTTAFFSSVLFMTAACFFHTHRQIMFINYMPFLILALIAVRKQQFRFLPLILVLIYVNSFYYSIACLAAIGWYWLRQEGKLFWKNGFLCYLKCTFLSIGMAALLLIPTALVILEHRRASESLSFSEVCGVNITLQSLLYSPYGMGLTAVCLYALILGLTYKKYRLDSIFLLVVSTWCLAAWLLNGTLYARAKILVPFVPLVILQCAKVFYALFYEDNELRWKIWPCLLLAAALPFQTSHKNFYWITADVLILTCVVLINRSADVRHSGPYRLHNKSRLSCTFLCIMPCLLFLQSMQKEQFVQTEDISAEESILDTSILKEAGSLYRYDSLNDVLNTGNLAVKGHLQKSAMYSSIPNKGYSDVYYETFQSPVQINNRLAILPSANPFLLNFLGVRFLETSPDFIPDGYHKVPSSSRDTTIIAENLNVLPTAYLTSSYISESQFRSLGCYEKLDAITRYTVIPDNADKKDSPPQSAETNKKTAGKSDFNTSEFNEVKRYLPTFIKNTLPSTIQIEKTHNGYLLDVKSKTSITLTFQKPLKEQILLLDFKVENYEKEAVVIDINHIRNKLSGSSAPYPNENYTFHYQFSDSQGEGIRSLDVTFSKGKYLLNNINWHTYSKQLLSQKKYTAVESHGTKRGEILSCTAAAGEDSYFITSIPMQKGMEILVDGKTVPILKVNQAFAGAKLEKGTHDIRIVFSAPGQKTGYVLSLVSLLIYLSPLLLWCFMTCFVIPIQRRFA